MAERVVDALEVVEVEEQHAEQHAAAARLLDRGSQALGEQPPVAEAGQRVVMGEEADLLLGAPPLGHVLRRALEPQRPAVVAVHHVRLAVDHALARIGEHDAEVGEEGIAGADRLADRLLQLLPVFGMDPREQLLGVDRLFRLLEPVERAQLARALDLAGREIDLEAPDPRAALGVVEVGAAAGEFREVSGHLRSRLAQVVEHVVEGARNLADLVEPRAPDPGGEVAAADPLGRVLDRADRAHEAAREQPDASSESTSDTAPASTRLAREWRSAARSAARSAPTRSSSPGSAATTRASSPRVFGAWNASGAPHRSDQCSTSRSSTASTATRRPSGPASERSSVAATK